ncbi:MAG: hypothetical protein FJ096_21260, partial [Deltaproteobacteria bacterium]|nr:hypothetical protein [Deltaproteobacteria bacterium]
AHAWLSGANGPVRREGKTAEGVATEALAQPRPSDLAVLVPSHDDARAVRGALARLGIPSVTAAKALVFSSPAARWLEAWLDAVETAGRDREARAAVVTPLFGWTADDLAWSLAIAERGEEAREEARAGGYGNIEGATATDARDWNAWTERLRRATERWRRHGFARTLDRELDELGVLPRVLAMTAGERHATDLRHLLELLHAEERRRRLGPGALADWMRAEVDEEASEREQRLESDADAVKIETIHVSKGLEYPIVLLPFAWQVKSRKKKAYEPLALRDGEGKLVDFHPPDTQEREDAERVAARELEREQLRLLYVATTRAKHRTIAWWGPVGKDADKTDVTPLGRLALREAERTFEDTTYPTFKEAGSAANPSPLDVVRARLAALSEASARSITWTIVPRERPKPARWSPPSTNDAPAEWPTSRKAPSFSGYWSVTSYSGLAKGAAATDRDERLRKDEPSVQAALDGSPAPTATRASEPDDGDGAAADVTKPTLESCDEFGRLTAGRGTVFGTFVHEVFERLDFAAFSSDASTASSDRDASSAELRRIATETGARQGFGATSREVTDAVARLPGILTTPLGAEPSLTGTTRHGIPTSMLPTDFTLAHLSKRDRLDELGFDLKLGDGTRSKRPPLRGRPSDRDKLDARPGCVDPRAVYAALGHERDALSDRDGPSGLDRQGHHAAHGLRGWLAYQLARKDAGRALVGSIAGILTGSIDLVFRVPRPEGGHTYFLADYKTNTIDASTAAHYAGPWLDWKMATSGYVLQSLLYTLALHRHLQARLLGYMYDHHVGGALYLFVRGMGGRATPTCRATGHRLGVHAHRWSARTIAALDEALAPLRTSDARAHTKDGAR